MDFALSSFLAIVDAVCSKTVPFEPELAVVVACGSCETSVDWVTRVEFWVSCEFLLPDKSCCDLRCVWRRRIDWWWFPLQRRQFFSHDVLWWSKLRQTKHRPSLFRISKRAFGSVTLSQEAEKWPPLQYAHLTWIPFNGDVCGPSCERRAFAVGVLCGLGLTFYRFTLVFTPSLISRASISCRIISKIPTFPRPPSQCF